MAAAEHPFTRQCLGLHCCAFDHARAYAAYLCYSAMPRVYYLTRARVTSSSHLQWGCTHLRVSSAGGQSSANDVRSRSLDIRATTTENLYITCPVHARTNVMTSGGLPAQRYIALCYSTHASFTGVLYVSLFFSNCYSLLAF